ncbi:MAG: SH3 domain-containing protein [Leptospiraceae bacterium]|nr:SH3 domain-containing protein [Leptospiraceae bacterium]
MNFFTIFILLSIFFCSQKENETTEPKKSLNPKMNKLFVQARNGLILRSEPSKKSKSIFIVPWNSEVEIQEHTGVLETIENRKGEWYKVKFKNKIGFMFSTYLDIFTAKRELITIEGDTGEKFSKKGEFGNYKINVFEDNSYKGSCFMEVFENSKLICRFDYVSCEFYSQNGTFYRQSNFGDAGAISIDIYELDISTCTEKNKIFGYQIMDGSYLCGDNSNFYKLESNFDQATNSYFSKLSCNEKIIASGKIELADEIGSCKVKIENDEFQMEACKLTLLNKRVNTKK